MGLFANETAVKNVVSKNQEKKEKVRRERLLSGKKTRFLFEGPKMSW
jgi:hypothetical protein